MLKDGVQQFWCVPYGAPTGGANRFMPPQKPAAWSGVKDHFEVTWAAPMDPDGEEPSPVVTALNRKTPQSEDCLTVNVFTPGLDNRARPVMVWMHGGGFSAGSGNYLLYDGTNLAKKEDVVVVSVNHRLNIFGFLHLAGLGGEKWAQATNVGVQDLVAALQWVKDNIESFGGDPDRVTIFGQSGGGGKTTTVMAMPSARGLFHRSIAQSGSAIRGQTADDATRRRRALPREARHRRRTSSSAFSRSIGARSRRRSTASRASRAWATAPSSTARSSRATSGIRRRRRTRRTCRS